MRVLLFYVRCSVKTSRRRIRTRPKYTREQAFGSLREGFLSRGDSKHEGPNRILRVSEEWQRSWCGGSRMTRASVEEGEARDMIGTSIQDLVHHG